MTLDSRLNELVSRWEGLRQLRADATPEEVCADCPELVVALKERLRALAAMHDFLGSSEAAPGPAAAPSPDVPGYELLGELGRGGMGVVYLAVQKATRRRVALKVMLQGRYATPRQRLRFEREVDLAAGLRHPHIVTIHDGGTTPDGLPYCVMEHIEGTSLDQYLREARPSLEQRLRLFAQVCAAVNYAHQRGIIPGPFARFVPGRPRAAALESEPISHLTLRALP